MVLVAVAILTYSSLVYFAGHYHHIIGVGTCLVYSKSLEMENQTAKVDVLVSERFLLKNIYDFSYHNWSKPNRLYSIN